VFFSERSTVPVFVQSDFLEKNPVTLASIISYDVSTYLNISNRNRRAAVVFVRLDMFHNLTLLPTKQKFEQEVG
jgi:hypothetical protein